jgi:sulfofructose kinase
MNHFDVLVIGRSCLDVIAVVDALPAENQKAPLAFKMTEGGGQGGTAACCISRLGGRVAYVGRLGDDDEGRFCLKRLSECGVATDHVEIVEGGRTPVAFIFVTRASGARTIVYEPSTLPAIALTPTIRSLAANSAVVMLDPETTRLAGAFKAMTPPRPKIVYDCERQRDGLADMMAIADYFIPTSGFLESAAAGEAAGTLAEKMRRLHTRLRGQLIVTRGETGAYYLSEDRIVQVRAPEVEVRDTIGAGDNFHAAFALAVARGMDLPRAVRLATATASLSCRNYGGRNGVPGWNEAAATADALAVRQITTATVLPDAESNGDENSRYG